MKEYLESLEADHKSAIEFGDFTSAYKIAGQIEGLQIKAILSQLGQKSMPDARLAFPDADYSESTLEIDGWDFAPNYHDTGCVMGWFRVITP